VTMLSRHVYYCTKGEQAVKLFGSPTVENGTRPEELMPSINKLAKTQLKCHQLLQVHGRQSLTDSVFFSKRINKNK